MYMYMYITYLLRRCTTGLNRLGVKGQWISWQESANGKIHDTVQPNQDVTPRPDQTYPGEATQQGPTRSDSIRCRFLSSSRHGEGVHAQIQRLVRI